MNDAVRDVVGQHSDVLAERDAKILDFEKSWWATGVAKDDGIRDRFAMSSTRYYQVLNHLIDEPAALRYDPLLVKRLRRMREQRQRERSASRAR